MTVLQFKRPEGWKPPERAYKPKANGIPDRYRKMWRILVTTSSIGIAICIAIGVLLGYPNGMWMAIPVIVLLKAIYESYQFFRE